MIENIVTNLGWTLIHFLWQAAAVVAVYLAVMALLRGTAPTVRYCVSVAALLAIASLPVLTFAWLAAQGSPASAAAVPADAAALVTAAAGSMLEARSGSGFPVGVEPLLPWAVAAWLAGVMVMAGRLFLGWRYVERLKRSAEARMPPGWEAAVERLCDRMGITRAVRVAECARASGPMVVGWLKPVILLPPAALMGLTPRQLETILAHELAHIRRHDYLVNLLQVVIETLLFYHPLVLWLSGRIRALREECCDDLAVAATDDVMTYARALAELENMRVASPALGLGATEGQLSRRIHRLVARPVPRARGAVTVTSTLVGALVVGTAATWQYERFEPDAAGSAPVEAFEYRATPSTASARISAPTRVRSRGDSGESQAAAQGRRTAAAERRGQARDSAGDEPDTETAAANASIETDRDGGANEPAAVAGPPAPTGSDGERPMRLTARADDAAAGPGRETAASRASPAPAQAERQTPRPPAAEQPGEDEQVDDESMRVASAQPSPRPETEPRVTGGEPLRSPSPQYPRLALRTGREDVVKLSFMVRRDGSVGDVQVVESGPYDWFSEAAVAAIRDWRFEPFRENGEPVTRRLSKEFVFELDEATRNACRPQTGTRLSMC